MAKTWNKKVVFFLALAGVMILDLQGYAQVRETTLSNGLKVITKEVHAAPVVSFMIWYKVGSRNEQLGKTGISHLLEHMQFKGTKTLKKGEIDNIIRRNGGISNAGTARDFTFYWETLPSDKLELAMRIESDRMANSILDPKELEAEKVVVLSELEGDENDPDELVYNQLYSLAFQSHPYLWPVIGRRSDVRSITRADLYTYYRRFYVPNNATIVIVGDFDTQKALALVQRYFAKIPKGKALPEFTAKEEPQLGERRAEIRKPGQAARIMIGFHTPAVGHPDIYALDAIEIILGVGTSSRLYRNLVDKQLATSVWASASTSKDPDLFLLGATVREGVDIQSVESALLGELERLKTEPVTDEELQKALNQIEANFIFTNDSTTNQARLLGYFETIFSWRFVDRYLTNARKVTKEDIKRVANKYFVKNNRCVVTFVPESSADHGSTDSTHRDKLHYAEYHSKATVIAGRQKVSAQNPRIHAPEKRPRNVATNTVTQSATKGQTFTKKPTRVVLENGMVVIVYENRSNPTVGIQGSINAGSAFDPPGKSGLASITAEMLMKGTQHRTAEQIAAEKDFNAISLDIDATAESAGFKGYALSKHFEKLLDLTADILQNPTFPAEEFEKVKARRMSRIKEEQDSPGALANRAFMGTVFPPGHPYHMLSVDEELANTQAITRDDVVGFFSSYYGPKGAILVVVGDIDTEQAVETIKKYFGRWSGGRSERPVIPDVPRQANIEKKVIPMPEKSQVEIILGYAGGLKRTDPNFYAATVMNFVLGGGGALGSRLGDKIRDQFGLVYDIYSTFDASLGAGAWYVRLGTNAKNVNKAIEAVIKEMKLMRDTGVSKKEMAEAIDYITGVFQVRLERNSSVASILWTAEFYGLGTDYIQRYRGLYRSVTLEQVNAAARAYIYPDRYTLVIAGPYRE